MFSFRIIMAVAGLALTFLTSLNKPVVAQPATATQSVAKLNELPSPVETLSRVRQSGVVRIGYRTSSPPLSFVRTGETRPSGYNIDICNEIASRIQAKFRDIDVKTEYVMVDGATRIPKLVNGLIDLECGSTTNTLERSKFVAFSANTFVDEDQGISRKSSNLHSLDDLDGKAIAVNPSSSVTMRIRSFEISNSYQYHRIYVKDHRDGFDAVQRGDALIYFELQTVLAGLAASNGNLDEYSFLDRGIDAQPIALMVRKDDAEFLSFVNIVISDMSRDGSLRSIFEKWFMDVQHTTVGSIAMPLTAANKNNLESPATFSAELDNHLESLVFSFPAWCWALCSIALFVLLANLALKLSHIIYPNRYRIPPDSRKFEHSHLPLTFCGGAMSFLIGFTLSGNISAINTSRYIVKQEALAVFTLRNATSLLPEKSAGEIRGLLSRYLRVVLDQEWADQRAGLPVYSLLGNSILGEVEVTLKNLEGDADARKAWPVSTLLLNLAGLERTRAERLVDSVPGTKVPFVVWAGLAGGACLSIVTCIMIGFRDRSQHHIVISFLCLAFGGLLVLIFYTDRPYMGNKGVSPEPYLVLQENFRM
jgi:glutamate/aspartate transport system substrate-binding protein